VSFRNGVVFLDRDGVLNEAVIKDGKPFPPASAEELVIVADAKESLEKLRALGFRLIVVTNQPDVRRGTTTQDAVEKINQRVREALPIDAFETCYHDDSDRCDCRKPKPGMLTRYAEREGIALQESFMIGDRWRDIEAGRSAGCRTILLGTGYSERLLSKPDFSVTTLHEAAQLIIEIASRREL
jgi:D-glycero-D-manno-heptose 1,7-bisphosphate phosphatase